MTGLNIVSSGSEVDVDFGDYGDGVERAIKKNYKKEQFGSVGLYNDHVLVILEGKEKYLVTVFDPANMDYLLVSELNGVPPVDLNDLYDRIKLLR